MYLWFAFFRPQEWVWFDISGLRISLFLALILVIPSVASGIFPNLTHPLSLGAILFLLSGLLAQMNAIDPAVGWNWVQFFAQLMLVCLLAVTLIRTPRDLMRAMAVAVLSLAYYATKAGLLSLVAGGVQFADDLGGAYKDNNSYAMVTVMIMPMLVALGQNAALTFEGLPTFAIKWIRRALYFAVPLCAYTVVCTFSRAGFLGLAAAIVTFVLLHPRRVRLAVGLLALSGLAFFVPLPAGYSDRLSSIQQAGQGTAPQEDVSEGRLYFWEIAVRMAQDHPMGIGMRNFSARFDSYDTLSGAYGEDRDVHSSHFQVLAEQGFLGAAAWVLQFSMALYLAWRVRRRAKSPELLPATRTFLVTVSTALIVSMVGFLVAGSFVSAALNDLTWLTFALLAALDVMSQRMGAPRLG